ncbi:HTH domain-containing protein [Moorena sp. SIO2C4]|uniref:MarR family transcriptional regulator n=1 Tax=Moorena sp. SIO2C4 TaxID=2607824 RepID=UPI0013C59D08|nr:HTH domain-containing protein [Moorena sp. SIO2C4]NES40531.1 HTH domain-containing protein [Moorena sp. SIO2C4]
MMEKILLNSQPVIYSTEIEELLNSRVAAAILQEIHFWTYGILIDNPQSEVGVEHEYWDEDSDKTISRRFYYRTYSQLAAKIGVSSRTVCRAISLLKEQGLILVKKLNADKRRRVNYYTVLYTKLRELLSADTGTSPDHPLSDDLDMPNSAQKPDMSEESKALEKLGVDINSISGLLVKYKKNCGICIDLLRQAVQERDIKNITGYFVSLLKNADPKNEHSLENGKNEHIISTQNNGIDHIPQPPPDFVRYCEQHVDIKAYRFMVNYAGHSPEWTAIFKVGRRYVPFSEIQQCQGFQDFIVSSQDQAQNQDQNQDQSQEQGLNDDFRQDRSQHQSQDQDKDLNHNLDYDQGIRPEAKSLDLFSPFHHSPSANKEILLEFQRLFAHRSEVMDQLDKWK